MLEELTRPFTESERRLLRRRAATPSIGSVFWMRDERRTLAWTFGVIVMFLAGGVLLHQVMTAGVVSAVFALLRFGGYRERRRVRQHQLSFRQRLTEELEAGMAYSLICRPKRIIERKEYEDEGALWIFDGGQGRYLALCGQDYYATDRFPSSHFEIVMGSRHRTVLGIRSHGSRMQSSIIVAGDAVPWETIPVRDVTLFAASPNEEIPGIVHALQAASTA